MTDHLSIVVIGRNEGERLTRCLESALAVAKGANIIYVDSASTDDSIKRARQAGVVVIESPAISPTAAAARNAGLHHAPGELVFLVDGDTVIHPDFLPRALPHFDDPSVVAVWGQRREGRPHRSVYQSVLEVDGLLAAPHDFGGDVLVRRQPILQAGAYASDMIANEDGDLSRRLRQAGHTCRYLPLAMTTHDLGVTTWKQYWRRAYRTGYGHFDMANRASHDHVRGAYRQSRRQMVHGILLATLLGLGCRFALAWGMLLALVGRIAWRHAELPLKLRLAYAVHTEVQQVPMLCGQIASACHRMAGTPRHLIEYR